MAKPKKPPYAKGRAQCIYCGSYENVTREHIWADWLREYIPRDMERHSGVSAVVHSDQSKNTTKVKKREGDFHAQKLRIACRSCNTGWMSRLQTKAKPYLIPTLTGNTISLYRAEQITLAAWTTMFVMTADYLDGDMVSITPGERAWLKDHQRPPRDWRIWIGRYERPATKRRWIHAVLDIIENEPEFLAKGTPQLSHAQTATILLGDQLIIHVMSSPAMRQTVKRWKILPAAAPAMKQIWPIVHRRVDWPSPATIQGKTIEDLAFHFFRRIDAFARRLERGGSS